VKRELQLAGEEHPTVVDPHALCHVRSSAAAERALRFGESPDGERQLCDSCGTALFWMYRACSRCACELCLDCAAVEQRRQRQEILRRQQQEAHAAEAAAEERVKGEGGEPSAEPAVCLAAGVAPAAAACADTRDLVSGDGPRGASCPDSSHPSSREEKAPGDREDEPEDDSLSEGDGEERPHSPEPLALRRTRRAHAPTPAAAAAASSHRLRSPRQPHGHPHCSHPTEEWRLCARMAPNLMLELVNVVASASRQLGPPAQAAGAAGAGASAATASSREPHRLSHDAPLRRFQEAWRRGEPLVISGVGARLREDWSPAAFERLHGGMRVGLVAMGDTEGGEEVDFEGTVGAFFRGFDPERRCAWGALGGRGCSGGKECVGYGLGRPVAAGRRDNSGGTGHCGAYVLLGASIGGWPAQPFHTTVHRAHFRPLTANACPSLWRSCA
jgi:hypothetical protein